MSYDDLKPAQPVSLLPGQAAPKNTATSEAKVVKEGGIPVYKRILDLFDRTRGAAASAHAFFSMILSALMMGITQLRQACYTLADKCISGITANEEKLRLSVENSIGLVTALSPMLGYENATLVAKRAQLENKTVREVVTELSLMSVEEFEAILGDVDRLAGPPQS